VSVLENGNPVATWELSGIHEAATVTYPELEVPLISLKVDLDSSGVVQLASAQAIFDDHVTVAVPIIEKPTGGNASNASTPSNDTEQAEKADDNSSEGAEGASEASQTQETPESPASAEAETSNEEAKANVSDDVNASSDANATISPPKMKNVTKVKKRKVQLGYFENFEGILPRPLSVEEKAGAMARLDVMNEADQEVRRVEAAKNTLEAFVYESREKLSSDENCLQVSTEEEREEISSMLMQTEDWLYEDEAMNGNASVFEAKINGLNEKVRPIKFRAFELEERPLLPELVEKVQDWVNQTLTFTSFVHSCEGSEGNLAL
jgi:hypoxia up-regulated 1